MSPSFSIGCIVIFFCLQSIYSANILFVTVTPLVSHQEFFQVVWRELSLRGHNVHVVTPNPLRDSSLTNLTEHDVSSVYGVAKNISMENKKHCTKGFLRPFLNEIYLTKEYSRISEETFRHKEVQKLLGTDIQFDVAVIDWLFPTVAGLGAKYNCPIVGISRSGAPWLAFETVGNPTHPISSPDHSLPITRDMTFRERLMSALYSAFARLWYHAVVLPRDDKLLKKYLGEDLPYLGDIERNVSVLLLNRNPVFYRTMPLLPAVIELGTIKFNRTSPDIDPVSKKNITQHKVNIIPNEEKLYTNDDAIKSNERNMMKNDNIKYIEWKPIKINEKDVIEDNNI